MTNEMPMQPAAQPAVSKRKRGFTLTEIAIVLGIIGLILGAIWGAASAVYSNKHTADAEQGITATAAAVRSLYATSTAGITGAAAPNTITVPGMLPVSWQNSSGGYSNPFATTTAATSWTYVRGPTATGTTFGVELDGVSGAGCSALLSYFGSNASSTNGGQITGLVGTQFAAAAPPVQGTPAIAAAVTSGAYVAPAGNCVTTITAPAAGSTSGNNNVMIVFDMAKM